MTSADLRPLAYSYVRMSTDAQLKGDSLRRQVELSRTYADQHHLQLVEDFKLHDIGVSAFKGDNAATGALSRFLEAVTSGKVVKGSYLLVESLDRLSRDKITAAMQLFLSITESGVNIVTLSDNQVYRAGNTDFPQLVYSMAIMSRANEESRIKSQRVGAAWKNKRDLATTKKLTSMVPNWLRLMPDRKSFEVIPDRADTVKRIYRWAADGHGTYSITQMLNAEGVPAFGRSNGWNESYVGKILKNRAVLGEYQPHSKIEGKRVAVGEVIADYYPPIIDEELFLVVQAGRRSRATFGGGRKGEGLKNLFTHIATCAYCGAPMRMVDKGKPPKGGRYLKCSAGVRGLDCTRKSWRYEDFERSFLFLAREIDLSGVMNAEATAKAATDLLHRTTAAEEKLTRLILQRDRLAELTGDPSVPLDYIGKKLATTQAEIDEVSRLLDQLRSEQAVAAIPDSDADGIRQMILSLHQLTGTEALEQRTRLAARLRSMVTSLKVALEGDRQRLIKTRGFLDASGADPQLVEDIVARIDEVARESHSYNPSFEVIFADGTVRKATVTTDDPWAYVNTTVTRPDGSLGLTVQNLSPRMRDMLADVLDPLGGPETGSS